MRPVQRSSPSKSLRASVLAHSPENADSSTAATLPPHRTGRSRSIESLVLAARTSIRNDACSNTSFQCRNLINLRSLWISVVMRLRSRNGALCARCQPIGTKRRLAQIATESDAYFHVYSNQAYSLAVNSSNRPQVSARVSICRYDRVPRHRQSMANNPATRTQLVQAKYRTPCRERAEVDCIVASYQIRNHDIRLVILFSFAQKMYWLASRLAQVTLSFDDVDLIVNHPILLYAAARKRCDLPSGEKTHASGRGAVESRCAA